MTSPPPSADAGHGWLRTAVLALFAALLLDQLVGGTPVSSSPDAAGASPGTCACVLAADPAESP